MQPVRPGCLYSWGGGDIARGWRGPSGGAGPAQPVPHLPGPVSLAAASRNSLAVTSMGRVLTWGHNDSRGGGDAWFVRGGHVASIPDSGQLGRPSRSGTLSPHMPGAVTGPLADEGAMALASGRYHALAIGARSRHVYSWGLNDHGQLGRHGWADRRGGRFVCHRGGRCRDGTPLPVALPSSESAAPTFLTATALAAGRYFSAAIGGNDGKVYVWGRCACGMDVSADGARAGAPPQYDSFGAPITTGVEDGTDDAAHATDAATAGGASARRFGGARAYVLSGGGMENDRAVAIAAGYSHLIVLTASSALHSCACHRHHTPLTPCATSSV